MLNMIRQMIITVFFIASVAFLVSCSSIGNAVMPQHRLLAMIQTDAILNPDAQGHPAPLSVYFFQLKKADTFQSADFFSLYNQPKKTIGGEFVAVSKIELLPSTRSQLNVNLLDGAKFIGIVAAYRDVQKIAWRKVLPINFAFGRKVIHLRFTYKGFRTVDPYESGFTVKKPNIKLNKPKFELPKGSQDLNTQYKILSKDNRS